MNNVVGGTISSAIGWIGPAVFVGWLVWTRPLPVKVAGPTTMRMASLGGT